MRIRRCEVLHHGCTADHVFENVLAKAFPPRLENLLFCLVLHDGSPNAEAQSGFMVGLVEDPVCATRQSVGYETVRTVVEHEQDPSPGRNLPGRHDPSEQFLPVPIETLRVDQEQGRVDFLERSSLCTRIGQEEQFTEIPVRIVEEPAHSILVVPQPANPVSLRSHRISSLSTSSCPTLPRPVQSPAFGMDEGGFIASHVPRKGPFATPCFPGCPSAPSRRRVAERRHNAIVLLPVVDTSCCRTLLLRWNFRTLPPGQRSSMMTRLRSRRRPIHGGKDPCASTRNPERSASRRRRRKNSRSTASFFGYVAFAVVLLGLFYFLLYSGHKKGLQRIRQEKIQEDFDRICAAAILHAQEHGTFPSTEQGIAALVKKVVKPSVPGGTSVSTGTLERMPLDPWRNPYVYRGSASADEITLISWGADGMQGGTEEAADVIRKGCRSTGLPLR